MDGEQGKEKVGVDDGRGSQGYWCENGVVSGEGQGCARGLNGREGDMDRLEVNNSFLKVLSFYLSIGLGLGNLFVA